MLSCDNLLSSYKVTSVIYLLKLQQLCLLKSFTSQTLTKSNQNREFARGGAKPQSPQFVLHPHISHEEDCKAPLP